MTTAVWPNSAFLNRPGGATAGTMSRATGSLLNSKVAVGASVVVVAPAAGIAAALAARGHTKAAPIYGVRVDRAVPSVPLLDEHGRHVALADYRGKIVVLSPVLTLCHEVCPLTTGAFMSMERAVRRAGLAGRVVFAEISVDPWRDSPARLRAFSRLTD